MTDKFKNISAEDPEEEKRKKEKLALFNNPEMEFEVKEMLYREISTFMTEEVERPDFQQMFEDLWVRIHKRYRRPVSVRKLVWNLAGIAAVLLIGVMIGVLAGYFKSSGEEPSMFLAHSPKGSISELVLPDSTIIFLNADSRISYKSSFGNDGKREVFLDGEAWFDVMKNKNRLFIVHTDDYDVNVTGTQFNVKAYESDNHITTTLEDGEVIIRMNAPGESRKESIVLKPGEQADLDRRTKNVSVNSVETKWYTSWKDNKLIFVNMDLEDLVILLERKYGVDIEFTNQEVLHLHFDGTLKNESIIEVLEILKTTLRINYRIVGQKIEIYK